MRSIYAGIDLLPIKTHEFSVKPVYDETNTDYLYSRARAVFEGVVNGSEVLVTGGLTGFNNGPPISYHLQRDLSTPPPLSDRTPPGPFVGPVGGIGIDAAPIAVPLATITRVSNVPPLTHASIRHRLSTPQGQWYVFSGAGMESGIPPVGSDLPPVGQLLLMAPEPDMQCDCKNGPIPTVLDIREAFGDSNTFSVVWACEAYFNEAALNGVKPSGALLSNRFSQTHQVDDCGWTTIFTEGTAIFRTDMLYDIPLSPDALRARLFLPVPQGFTRTIPRVTGLPDGTGIRYEFEDEQQKVNFVAGPYAGVAKITAVHRQVVTVDTNILGGALDAYERVLGIKANRSIAGTGTISTPAAPTPRGLRAVTPPAAAPHRPVPPGTPGRLGRLKGRASYKTP